MSLKLIFEYIIDVLIAVIFVILAIGVIYLAGTENNKVEQSSVIIYEVK